ncbi:MAG: hypothetical protein H3C38_17085 [Rhodospirillales bacterium]|nr:hypothetical protein [Rhodospirillales bacterium]
MTLIVEDGSGRADANAYVTISYADDYHALRDNAAWEAATEAAREAAIIRATDHLDRVHRYRGEPLSAGQALAWPRTGVEDRTGRAVTGVPAGIRRACAELALRALAEDLDPDLPHGGRVKSETVGPISTTYFDGAPGGKTRPAVSGLLGGLTAGAGLERA